MTNRFRVVGRCALTSRSALMLHQEAGNIRGMVQGPLAETDMEVAVVSVLRRKITANDERYIAKSGGRHGTEKFTVPFNRERT